MFKVGQEVLCNENYGTITALPPPEDTEKQGMAEVTIHGHDPEWVGECFVEVVTDEMRRAQRRYNKVVTTIVFGGFPEDLEE